MYDFVLHNEIIVNILVHITYLRTLYFCVSIKIINDVLNIFLSEFGKIYLHVHILQIFHNFLISLVSFTELIVSIYHVYLIICDIILIIMKNIVLIIFTS